MLTISGTAQQIASDANVVSPPEQKTVAASRTRKASMNSIASTLDYATRLLVSFIIKPILVSRLGTYGFGAWEVLGKLAGYLGPATGQASHALRWTTAHEQASEDYHKKRLNVGSAVVAWALLFPICCALVAALTWWAPYWLESPPNSIWAVRIAAFLLGTNVALAGLVEIPRSVLEGENLGYKRMGMSALLLAVGGGLTAAVVWLDLGLVGLASVTVFISCLTGMFYLRVARTQVVWFGISRPSWTAVRQFIRLSGWFLLWHVTLKLLRASDVVVLGILGSVELVTIYSLTKYAPETAINLVAIVVFGVTPGLGGIIGAGEIGKAARIRAEILALTWLIATVAGTTTLLWNRSFLQLWVGQEYDAGITGTLLMVVMVSQFVLLRSDANVIDLTLDLRGKVLVGFVAAVCSLVLAGLFVGLWNLGIQGLCLGLIMGRLVLSFAYPWIIGRHLGVPIVTQLLGAIRPCLVTAAVFFLAAHFGSQLVTLTWAGLVLGVGASLVLLPLPIVVLGMRGDLRQRIHQRLLGLVRQQTFHRGHA